MTGASNAPAGDGKERLLTTIRCSMGVSRAAVGPGDNDSQSRQEVDNKRASHTVILIAVVGAWRAAVCIPSVLQEQVVPNMTDTKGGLSGGPPALTTAHSLYCADSGDMTIKARAVSSNGLVKA